MSEYTGRVIPPIEGLHDSEAPAETIEATSDCVHVCEHLYESECEGQPRPCRTREEIDAHPAEPVGVSDATSLGLARSEIRDEVDELIRNAYAEGWREAKQRPDAEPPLLDINWTRGRGVLVTEMWCECEIDPDRRLLIGPHHEPSCLRYTNGPARPPESIERLLRGESGGEG